MAKPASKSKTPGKIPSLGSLGGFAAKTSNKPILTKSKRKNPYL